MFTYDSVTVCGMTFAVDANRSPIQRSRKKNLITYDYVRRCGMMYARSGSPCCEDNTHPEDDNKDQEREKKWEQKKEKDVTLSHARV